MKNPKSRKYVWIAFVLVAGELCVLLVKTNRAYRRQEACAALDAAINRCSAAAVRSALDRGANAAADVYVEKSFFGLMLETLQGTPPVRTTVFNSSPLARVMAIRPAVGVHPETWNAERNTIVMLLLEHGAGPNGKPGYDFSPLYLAIDADDVQLAEELLAHGASANGDTVTNSIGLKSPVLLAAVCRNNRGNPAMVRLLIQHGADVDCANMAGQTALMLVAGQGDANMATMLLSLHARRDVRDVHGKTAADYVRRAGVGREDSVQLLRMLAP